jgi:hypothetical protein
MASLTPPSSDLVSVSESNSTIEKCNCQFVNCEMPLPLFDTTSSGVVVTWCESDPETRLLKLRNRVRNYITYIDNILRQDATDNASLVDNFVCPACVDRFTTLSSFMYHLVSENRQLSQEIVQILDLKSTQSGKFVPRLKLVILATSLSLSLSRSSPPHFFLSSK